MRLHLVSAVLALSLAGPPAFAQAPTNAAVRFVSSACLESGGDADRLTRISTDSGWARLSPAETVALRSGTVRPRSEVGYRSGMGLVYFADYGVITLCSVHVQAEAAATQSALERWSIDSKALGAPDMVQASITNRLVSKWRNHFWGVARGGVDAVNLNIDPDGDDLIIELSFPRPFVPAGLVHPMPAHAR